MSNFNGKGMTKAAMVALKKVFPDARPKLGETLEQIHRREGQQEVLAYIQKVLVND
jgi:hypothetical protein